jgi:hypothetical protein
MPAPPEALRSARIIAAGMLASVLLFLAMAWFMRMREPGSGVPLMAYVTAAYALLVPFHASFMRAMKPVLPWEGTAPAVYAQALTARTIVSYAPLEAAALFCGIALILGPFDWPLLAALVPLFTMLAWFPRHTS